MIRQTSRHNPLWGAPRIHGELRKLGMNIGETSVSKYLVREGKPPSQTWRTFLEIHFNTMMPVAFFLPCPQSGSKFCTCSWYWRTTAESAPRYLLRDRDREGNGHQTSACGPAVTVAACLVFNERSLHRHLKGFIRYYHRSRTHLALEKDSPEHRPIQPPNGGPIIALPKAGGLHHRYERRAA